MLDLNNDAESDFAVQVRQMQYDVVFHSMERMPVARCNSRVAMWPCVYHFYFCL